MKRYCQWREVIKAIRLKRKFLFKEANEIRTKQEATEFLEKLKNSDAVWKRMWKYGDRKYGFWTEFV